MDGRIIIESASGADIMELKLPDAVFEQISYVTVIRGHEVYRLQVQPRRPILSSATPEAPYVAGQQLGWTCPNPRCNSVLDPDRDRCSFCGAQRPPAW